MNFIYVNSSDIKCIAIDDNDLIIEFHSGGIYKYICAACEYNNLLKSSSLGKYFHQNIKDKYKTIKIN